MADYTGYLDPSIVNYVQGVDPSAPVDAFATTLGPRGGSTIDPPPPPPPPPPQPLPSPPLPGELTKHIGVAGAPIGPETYGLPPEIVAHVQGVPLPSVPDSTVPSVTGGAMPPDLGMAPQAPVAQPDYVAGTAPIMTPKDVAASNAKYDKQQAAQAAYDASPDGLNAQGDAQQRAALAKEQQANTDAANAEIAQNDANARVLAASADRQAEQKKIDDAKAAEDQANVQKYTQQYAQQIKDAADYKIDTNRDVGVRGLIAIALSGIGDALDHRHGPNAAAQIIDAQIDKRISDQWAQKRALGDKAAGTKSVLDQFTRISDNDDQAEAKHQAAERLRVADELRQAAAQSADPAVKARALTTSAALDQKAAVITQNIATRKTDALRAAQEERDRQAQLGVAYGNLDLNRRQFNASRVDADRNFALNVGKLNADGKDAQAKALQAQQDEVQQGGVPIPSGVDDQGKPTFSYAINGDGKPYIVPEKMREKANQVYAATKQAVDAIDKMGQLRDANGGHLLNTADAREMAQEAARAILAIPRSGGLSRLTEQEVDLAKKMISGDMDPDSFVHNVMPNLARERDDLEEDLNGFFRAPGMGYTGKDNLQFAKPVKAKETIDQRREGEALTWQPEGEPGTQTADRLAAAGKDRPSGLGALDAMVAAKNETPVASSPTTPIPDYIKGTLDTLIATANSPTAPASAKDHARTMLQQLADGAHSEAVKRYADVAVKNMLNAAENKVFGE